MRQLVRDRIPRASALALVLLLPGCRARDAVRPATLVLGQPTSALTLDPYLHDEESTYSTLEHFYERLVAFGHDMELVPELALSWQNPTDTVWRIRLRKGVLFHDGRPLEAEDVAASIRRARRLPGSKVAHDLEGVVDVRVPDPGIVEIVTGRPSPVLLNKLAFVGIVPRDAPLSPIVRRSAPDRTGSSAGSRAPRSRGRVSSAGGVSAPTGTGSGSSPSRTPPDGHGPSRPVPRTPSPASRTRWPAGRWASRRSASSRIEESASRSSASTRAAPARLPT